jgi:putative SOS response-associated peptidase YedK
MCGRFAVTSSVEDIGALFNVPVHSPITPRFNIAPTQPILVVRLNEVTRKRELVALQWGLVPEWSKEPQTQTLLINARAETITAKPSFRSAYQYRRCLIPVNGFYEWQRQGQGQKQPMLITGVDAGLMAFGAIWECWSGPDGESALETVAIVTKVANPIMAQVHGRMPVIVDQPDFGMWMGEGEVMGKRAPKDMIKEMGDEMASSLTLTPVSLAVNNIRNDGPDLWEVSEVDEPTKPPKPDQGSLF